MDKSFEHLIKVNTQGRVFVTCQTRGVTDPLIIGYYVEILEQAILSELTDDSTVADFNRVLNEEVVWLEGELDQVAPVWVCLEFFCAAKNRSPARVGLIPQKNPGQPPA